MQQSLAQRTEAFNAEGDRSESFLTAELLHVIDHPHAYKPALQITMSFNRFPTAPSLGEEGESSGSGLYPSLHEQATMPRLAMNMNKMVKTLMILKMVLMMTVIRVRAKVLAIMLMTNMEMMVKTVMAHKSTKLDFGDNEDFSGPQTNFLSDYSLDKLVQKQITITSV